MRTPTLLLCVAALCAVMSSAAAEPFTYTPAAEADRITHLPGLAAMPGFNMFSGYLVVDAAVNRSIFYWYVESQTSPATDPLFWWSNGGPGCSGLLGFLTEHGPFRTAPSGGGLETFPFSWNNVANMLYVEAPAGVGFSFSDDPRDYTTGDYRTAHDNYAAIGQFFERFPHLKSNEFYISAESYGGHYVPTLASVIVQQGGMPNFKGFLLGNPLTDMNENMYWGQAGTLCGHSLASKPTCDKFAAHCLGASPDSECDAAQSQVVAEAGNLDAYGLDFPTCPQTAQRQRLLHYLYKHRKHASGFNPSFKAALNTIIPTPYDPCETNEETAYLNRADVREAIHVDPRVGKWAWCSTVLNYNQSDVSVPMEPVYEQLLAVQPPLRMVIFSGDDDSVCATLGTQHWMFEMLGKEVESAWSPWMYTDEEYGQQIAGYVTKFRGISLVTVHGAGHMVSGYKPQKGLAVIQNFIAGDFN